MEIQIQAGIDPNAILREVSRIAALPALAELIDNSFDAGSLNCEIFTDHPRKPTHVLVVDSGTGMNNDGLTAFFNYGRSEWLTKRHKGRNGKGSKYMFYHAKQIMMLTKAQGESMAKQFTITLNEWMEKILSRQMVSIASVSPTVHQKTPASESFTVFDIEPEDNKRQFFSEENLRENLANHLSPQFASRVFVNGKPIKPLEDLTGITFESNDPTLGEIRAYLYHPDKIRYREGMRIDDLRIGAIGPVMEFHAFIKGLPAVLRERIPTCFHTVCGLIEVEGFNEWREGASREFRDELYLSPSAEVFVSFLENVLGPFVSKEFGFADAAIEDRAQKSLHSLRELSEKIWGPITNVCAGRPRKQPGSSTFNISPFSIEMIPGEKQTFSVTQSPEERTFEWDESGIPGAKLDRKDGKVVELTIDPHIRYSPDQYQLVVKLLPFGLIRRAHIKLVPFKEMAIVPRSGSYFVDDRIVFKAVNVPLKCKTLSWSVEPNTAGEFAKDTGFDNITFVCKTAVKAAITAIDPANPLTIRARTEIYINEKELETRRIESTENVIRIEDVVFVIKSLSHDQPIQAIKEELSDKVVLHINVQHPRYKQTLQGAQSAFDEYLIHLMVAQYVSLVSQKREMTDQEKEALTGQLLARMIL